MKYSKFKRIIALNHWILLILKAFVYLEVILSVSSSFIVCYQMIFDHQYKELFATIFMVLITILMIYWLDKCETAYVNECKWLTYFKHYNIQKNDYIINAKQFPHSTNEKIIGMLVALEKISLPTNLFILREIDNQKSVITKYHINQTNVQKEMSDYGNK
mgnify:FL=1